MRTKLNVIASLITGLIFGLSANAQKTVIKKEALPANAQAFLKTHFGSKKPSYILEDKEILSTEYKVQFEDKLEIEFDKKETGKKLMVKILKFLPLLSRKKLLPT
ncbi:hypothetical protein [Flavobacterium sp.]|uniref:hypothetical protein n=1 Tax=Flavobacterium sp. TaxID=239 RepID=UPI00374DDCC0